MLSFIDFRWSHQNFDDHLNLIALSMLRRYPTARTHLIFITKWNRKSLVQKSTSELIAPISWRKIQIRIFLCRFWSWSTLPITPDRQAPPSTRCWCWWVFSQGRVRIDWNADNHGPLIPSVKPKRSELDFKVLAHFLNYMFNAEHDGAGECSLNVDPQFLERFQNVVFSNDKFSSIEKLAIWILSSYL